VYLHGSESPPVESGEGILLALLSEIEVECLPQDLPHEIKVDISGLTAVEQGISIGQLPIDRGKITILGHEPEELVVKIDYPQAKEEEEAPAEEEKAVAGVEATEEKPEEKEGEAEGKEGGDKKEGGLEVPTGETEASGMKAREK